MKKTLVFITIIIIILLIPIPHKLDDGKEYKALIYKITIKDSEKEKGTSIKLFGIEISNSIKKQEDNELKSIDEFYQNDLVKQYKDIRELKKDYSEQEAIKDNCFVIGEEVSNDNLFSEFFEAYQNKKSKFIRTIEFTIEGDMMIYDLLYDAKTNKIYIVFDPTRDRNGVEEISFGKYEQMTQYEYLHHTYWVLYNGELTDKNLFSDSTFIVSSV